MNIFVDFLKHYPRLILEGATLKDKMLILLYSIYTTPLYLVNRIRNRRHAHTFLSSVALNNSAGKFICGKDFFSCWIAGSFHEREVKGIMDRVDGGVFIDVGAHIGTHTIRVARKLGSRGKVIAFEPNPHNFSLLEKNIKLNNLKNIKTYPAACSNKNGKASLYIHGFYGGSYVNSDSAGGKKVDSITLDTAVKENKVKRVGLIKIDVEGFEPFVLMGAKETLRKFTPNIIFEAWDKERLAKVMSILKPYGYQAKALDHMTYYATCAKK